jgi:hypothetical protein
MSASLLQTFCPRDQEWLQLVETSPRKPSQQEGCQVGGTNDAALLVRVAEVSQGRRVTDSDRRAGGVRVFEPYGRQLRLAGRL